MFAKLTFTKQKRQFFAKKNGNRRGGYFKLLIFVDFCSFFI